MDPSSSVLASVGAEITGIVAPVSICMLLVVLLVHRLTPHGSETTIPSVATLVYTEKASDSTSQKLEGALLNSLVFVIMISMVTFLLVLLYYFRCIKFLKYYMCVSAAMVLAYMGGAVSVQLIEAMSIKIDVFTFVVLLFNFTVVGVLAVFMTSMPILITQFYLVMIGMLVAFWFTMLPEWTTWMLLVAMALYDLVAVLAPGGPLKLLVELAISRDEDIPALIYESRPVSVVDISTQDVASHHPRPRRWKRRDSRNDHPSTEMQPLNTDLDTIISPTDVLPSSSSSSTRGTQGRLDLEMQMGLDSVESNVNRLAQFDTCHEIESIEDDSARSSLPTTTNHRHAKYNPRDEIENAEDESVQSPPIIPGNMHARHEEIEDAENELIPLMNAPRLVHVPTQTQARHARAMDHEDEDEVDGFGLSTSGALKLGLGDFVFYSLLVGRAAMYDLMTVYACYLAIIAGLGSTLMLLAVARRALPALPISIGLGVIFYFLTRLLMEPLVAGLSTSLVIF